MKFDLDILTPNHQRFASNRKGHAVFLENLMAGFLRGGFESNSGESENKSVGSRRAVSVLGRGSEVFETGLETPEGN